MNTWNRLFRTCLPLILVLTLLCACGQAAETTTWQEQYDLGVKYLDEGKYEEAILAFTAAIELDPKRPEAFIGRGDAYVLSGETEDNLAAALADYQAALDLDETLAEIYGKLADVYLLQGDTERAQAILQEGYEVTQAAIFQDRLAEMADGPDLETPETSSLFDNLVSVDEFLHEGTPVLECTPDEDGRVFFFGSEVDVRGLYVGMEMEDALEILGLSEEGKDYVYQLKDYTGVIINVINDTQITMHLQESTPYEKDIMIWYSLEENENFNSSYLVLGFNANKVALIEVHAE